MKRKAFTLLELMLATAITSVLAAGAAVFFLGMERIIRQTYEDSDGAMRRRLTREVEMFIPMRRGEQGKLPGARNGFALVFSLVLTAAVIVTLGAVGGYVAHMTRMTRIHLATSRCRLAAQSALEDAKSVIQEAFESATRADAKIDPRQVAAYNWFYTVSSDGRAIGSNPAQPLPDDLVIDECMVHLGVSEPSREEEYPRIPLYATAQYRYPDGLAVSVTIRELVLFGVKQSPVFDYAYFVNNYGWMNGSSIVINGDMRANGNVNLSGSTVNGFVYAAKNSEVGANGSITLASNPQIKNAASYRTAYGNRSRPDMGDYDTSCAYDAPVSSGTIRKATYTQDRDGNFLQSSGTFAANSRKPIVNEKAPSIPMPFVSELDSYVEYANDLRTSTNNPVKAQLTAPAYSYTDGLGKTRSVAAKTVDVHYTGAGPSGDAALADNGALVLIGTKTNPIRIDGPVVVDSDVVIKGYVKGQGTIYSGRNVHIIGDIIYSDPPTWNHTLGDDNRTEMDHNAKADMLGLIAKGNIVIGDSSADNTTWHNSVDAYIKSGTSSSVVKKYACDPSDANIGYPSTFQGNYTAIENVNGQQFGKVRPVEVTKTREEHYQERYVTGYDRWGRAQYGYRDAVRQVNYTETVLGDALNRRYYETVCDDNVLKKLKDTAGIAQIDAILYNNHGIFGTPGRANATFNLNGSLVCRDEALIFSGNGIRFNWDFRLGRKNKKSDVMGLPRGPAAPYVVEWKEVSDEENPTFRYWGNEEGDK